MECNICLLCFHCSLALDFWETVALVEVMKETSIEVDVISYSAVPRKWDSTKNIGRGAFFFVLTLIFSSKDSKT